MAGRKNRFYGSLKSFKDLNKLKILCVADTDVDGGLEYSPVGLLEHFREVKVNELEWQKKIFLFFDCRSHTPQAKCKVIQDKLRPFNYDLEA